MLSMKPSPVPLRSASPENPVPPWKRGFDLVFCLLALPPMLAAAACVYLWIRLTSPGPIFFKQERVGYKGNRFLLYKFRTMQVNADTTAHRTHFSDLVQGRRPMQKLDAVHDVRLIRGGWLLRASGADELPQIINVLRGEMSLVGPRPCIPYEYENYSPQDRRRLGSVPGLTGLWQVSGKNRTTFQEMVRLDIEYSRTKSLALDLRIALKTLPALWTQIADTRFSRRRARSVTAPVSPVSSVNIVPPAPSPTKHASLQPSQSRS